MTDRAALVERVAQMFCSQVDLECSECKTEGGCWYADIATAAVSLIRAEVLEEAAVIVEFSPHSHTAGEMCLMRDKAAAIRALKDKQHD